MIEGLPPHGQMVIQAQKIAEYADVEDIQMQRVARSRDRKPRGTLLADGKEIQKETDRLENATGIQLARRLPSHVGQADAFQQGG